MGSNGEQNKTYQATNFSEQELLSNHYHTQIWGGVVFFCIIIYVLYQICIVLFPCLQYVQKCFTIKTR